MQRSITVVARAMGRQAYNDGRTLLNESLVRAAVVRYRRANEGAAAAEAELREQFGRSFLWIRGLDSTLARYEGARARYPTIDAFMPEVGRFFNDVAATMPDRMRQFNAARPRLIRITPADSAASVGSGYRHGTAGVRPADVGRRFVHQSHKSGASFLGTHNPCVECSAHRADIWRAPQAGSGVRCADHWRRVPVCRRGADGRAAAVLPDGAVELRRKPSHASVVV